MKGSHDCHAFNTLFSKVLFYCMFAIGCSVVAGTLSSNLLFSENVSTFDDTEQADIIKKWRRKKLEKDEKTVEICLSDIESVLQSRDGGANSVEICTSRVEGGITPSLGLVKEIVDRLKSTNMEVHVLIRPRPGNFCYSSSEFDIMLRDILEAREAGVDGVVVGVLMKDAALDVDRMRIVRSMSEGIQLTFHRAFDVCTNPTEALEQIIEIGCDRLLTSGRAPSASSIEGIANLRKIVKQASGRIRVVAAAGVNARNVGSIIESTNVQGVHAGSAVTKVVDRRVHDLNASAITTLSSNFGEAQGGVEGSANAIDTKCSTGGGFVALGPRVHAEVEEEMSSWTCADCVAVRELVDTASETWEVLKSDQARLLKSGLDLCESSNSMAITSDMAQNVAAMMEHVALEPAQEGKESSTATDIANSAHDATLPVNEPTNREPESASDEHLLSAAESLATRVSSTPSVSFSSLPETSTSVTPEIETVTESLPATMTPRSMSADSHSNTEGDSNIYSEGSVVMPNPMGMTHSYVHVGMDMDESFNSAATDD